MDELITPVGGKHAIEVMAIGIEWASQLDAVALHQLEAVYNASPTISSFLPVVTPVRSLVFQLGIASSAVADDQSGGFDARQVNPEGNVLWSLSIRPDFLACNCMEYDRWSNIKPQAISLLSPLLIAALNGGNKIKAIGLQYQDAFNISGSINSELLQILFREDSRMLPRHVFEMQSLWHSHQGWFSISPRNQRVLNNVNLDLIGEYPNHVVRIQGQHRVFSITSDGKESLPMWLEDIEQILNFLHAQNIDVLKGILSQSILKKIGID